jgi:hypothetical protein
MKRGDIVEYTFPGLIDAADVDTIKRARATMISRLAIVRSITATTADIVVLDAEHWESPRLVRGVAIDDGTARTPNRNQVADREAAIEAGTLDAIRDVVKGWVKVIV